MPMMNALRMVWIISRHYSDDAKMGRLFRQIAHVLAQRVEAAVDIRALFEVPAQDALQLLSTALAVLLEWREAYMKVRVIACWSVFSCVDSHDSA